MKNLKKLMELRAEKETALAAIIAAAETENRAASSDESAEFDKIEAEIKAIDATIQMENRAETLGNTVPAAAPEVENRAEAESKAFTALITNRKVENRAGEIQLTQGANGTIVPKTISSKIIETVKNECPFLAVADVIQTNGELSVPVYSEDATNYIAADYVDEGSDLTDNIGKFTTVDLKGYTIGALALISNKLRNNTDVDVTGFTTRKIGEALASKIEREFVLGTSNKITGITSTTNTITAAAAIAVTYDELVALKHKINSIYRSNARWLMHPDTYSAICKLKDSTGRPYFDESKNEILGLPVMESDNMPAMTTGNKAIVFGDFTGYTIKSTSGIEVQVLMEKYSTRNMIGVIGYGEFDGKITDSKKIAAIVMA